MHTAKENDLLPQIPAFLDLSAPPAQPRRELRARMFGWLAPELRRVAYLLYRHGLISDRDAGECEWTWTSRVTKLVHSYIEWRSVERRRSKRRRNYVRYRDRYRTRSALGKHATQCPELVELYGLVSNLREKGKIQQ